MQRRPSLCVPILRFVSYGLFMVQDEEIPELVYITKNVSLAEAAAKPSDRSGFRGGGIQGLDAVTGTQLSPCLGSAFHGFGLILRHHAVLPHNP